MEKIPQQEDICCSRASGRDMLEDIIKRLRARADDLETLSNALPKKLTPAQDEALWKLACDLPR